MPILAATLAAALLLVLVLGRVTVRTDMADFLPEGRTEAARLMLQELRAGAATGLLLAGIEGAPAPELARVSQAMTAALQGNSLFRLVAGGQAGISAREEELFLARRYLLSPTTAPEAFEEPALRASLEGLLRQLRSSASGPLASRYGFADPTGALLPLVRAWVGSSRVRTIDGAWFAPDRGGPGQDRALLLARTQAGGMDVPAQEAADAAIRTAFQDAHPPPGTRLLLSGPAVFARDAARAMRADVRRISVVSAVLVALLLWAFFRRLLVVAAIAAPVVFSVAVAALAVQLGFGAVHGVALGFGITMLGVSLDYPVLMIGHRKAGEAPAATRKRIGEAFVLAVATAMIGLGGMAFSGFPGMAQLGAFSAVGLATAALATWFLLPPLVVAADLAPVPAGSLRWLDRVERLRRWRLVGGAVVGCVLLALAVLGGPRWEGDLQALSPVPEASRALDAELRAALGAPEVGQLLVVRGPDAETVLRRQEALLSLLDRLQDDGAIGGAELAARLLPSAAAQEARRAALPDPEVLAARLERARAGLPFREGAFRPFLDGVAASRTLAPLRLADLAGSPLGARLEPLLFERAGTWHGPVLLQDVRDSQRLRAALLSPVDAAAADPRTLRRTMDATPASAGDAASGAAVYVDMRAELGGVLAEYTGRTWRWLGWGIGLIVLALALGLRSVGRAARVLGAVAAALGATAAVLTFAGVRFSLIHVVALQLVAGVGLDYALFFARRQLDAEERARTLRTLLVCISMTLLSFGLLATCSTPLLRDIGITVGLGALLAMCCAFLFVGPMPGRRGDDRGTDRAAEQT